jgi:hypothetical protein
MARNEPGQISQREVRRAIRVGTIPDGSQKATYTPDQVNKVGSINLAGTLTLFSRYGDPYAFVYSQ